MDKLFVDKYEQINTLGNIGIKDLSGQLNIGTSYENTSPHDLEEEWKGEFEKLKKLKENHKQNKHEDESQDAK